MATTSVSTPIPTGVSVQHILQALHNHELMIRTLCPSLITYSLESGNPASTATYSVTDKKPVGQTTYKLTLTNTPYGIKSLVQAKPSTGTLTIAGNWCISNGTLREDVEIEGNFMMKKMAKGNVERTHPQQHSLLLQQATA
ncbi:hypothetical protein BU16DRAFT_528380 [Lophium mytilinum]|uniref:DUF7053 domain-containing protein n=1 Tax=Lophium mytilinum TaxID=390894 RepID=A0A6A6QQD9_9PEZI|nr:hypothetical protein BU16DRAFT_528380 [Lophium mytilinum]